MDDYTRLSELTGIADEDSDFSSYFPINVALLLLGAALLGVSFYFLDANDTRVLYNPWTYAVATPVVLALLSTFLKTFASRLIEKSMQLAVLLSVLLHVLLLVYAVNIVIFSRMWPDMLESFARQRHQIQRETLRANQYHRLSVTSQTGRKPDYLRHVPTKHEPTETDDAPSPLFQLTENQKLDLVSPTPQLERWASPHLLSRPKPAVSLPNYSQQTASLSRSQPAVELNSNSSAEARYAAPVEQADPRELAPSESRSSRSSLRDRATALTPAPSVSTSANERVAKQWTPPIQSAAAEPSLATGQPRANLPRSASLDQARQLVGDIESPDAPAESTNTRSAPRPDESPAARRRSSSSALALQPSPSVASPRPASPTGARAQRRAVELQNDSPPGSQTPQRSASAGGRSGASAPLSMPVFGPEAAANDPARDSGKLQPLPGVVQRSATQRAAIALPDIGSPSSQRWSGETQIGAGIQGRSPAEIAQSAVDGAAERQDSANLSGDARAIVRSSLGSTGTGGPPSQSVPVGESTDTGGSDGLPGTVGPSPSSLAAADAAIRRNSGGTGGQTIVSSAGLSAPVGQTQLLQPGNSRIARAETTPGDRRDVGRSTLPGAISRSDTSSGAPATKVATMTPADEPSDSSGIPGTISPAETSTGRRRGQSIGSNLAGGPQLDIRADAGVGGLNAELGKRGPLLARNDRRATPDVLQIDSQRFARQDVGGPLAAGQNVTIPTPAFRQRLDRLRDREHRDETKVAPQTELAIERGLAFLAKHQRSDGSWRLQDFDTRVLMRSDTAATGLALLAFQGAGYTHREFKYADNVSRAIHFLTENQTAEGDLYIRQDPASDQNAWLYSHAIAALAMCEAYGMTQDDQLRTAAQKSVDFMVLSQDPQRGGWRYRPGSGSDTSVTGWFMMAFKSGQLAGLEVPAATLDRMQKYLDQSQSPDGKAHLYRYNPYASDTPQQRHGLQPTSVMTSVGLLMRLYTGWNRADQKMIAGADYLLQHLPQHGTTANSLRDTYYWYYATQVMFHMRGEHWKRWHEQLYPLLINNQVSRGEYEGSWNPTYPTPDLWARYGGRLYVTTMNLLSLEVSYRHLPLYEAAAQ